MQDQSNETPVEQDHRTEQTVLVMLLGDGQRIWSLDELVAEIGRRMETVDALAALQAAGLVHPALLLASSPLPLRQALDGLL